MKWAKNEKNSVILRFVQNDTIFFSFFAHFIGIYLVKNKKMLNFGA